MDVFNLKDFYQGWIIGNFNPSVYKTQLFEVGVVNHKKGEIWPVHTHLISTEINVLLDGKMVILGKEINPGDVFKIQTGEWADPVFLEDCRVLVVKFPSAPGDKYFKEVNN